MVNLSSRPIYVTRFHSQDRKAMPERKQWVKVKLLRLLSVLWAWWVLIGLTASGKLGGSSNLGKWYSTNVCTTLIDSRLSGELQIAEVTSRFTNIQQFLDLVNSIGFRLKSKVGSCNHGRFSQTDCLISTIQDESNSHFILFEFIKVARTAKTQQEWTQLLSKGEVLKPCEYKRRWFDASVTIDLTPFRKSELILPIPTDIRRFLRFGNPL